MKLIITFFISLSLLSCKQEHKIPKEPEYTETDNNVDTEKFELMNVDKINQLLESRDQSLSAKDVVNLYYPIEIETEEGNEKIEIYENSIKNGNVTVTLIHDNMLDDSQRGLKYVMELERVNDRWKVIAIKKNWKCWDGKGHTDWGIEMCK